MVDTLTPPDAELYRRIDEVVHYLWDPIGVSGIPEARDEYQGYLTGLFGRVKTGELDFIVEYMRWIVTDRMGLHFDGDKARHIAELLLEWKRVIEGRKRD